MVDDQPVGNTMFLYPEAGRAIPAKHRGRDLSKSSLGALVRHAESVGVADVRRRVYGRDQWARQNFIREGTVVNDVHLRKDLT